MDKEQQEEVKSVRVIEYANKLWIDRYQIDDSEKDRDNLGLDYEQHISSHLGLRNQLFYSP